MFDGSKEPKETRIRDIYTVLKENNIDVYLQGQHQGHCLSPYVVLRSLGESKLVSYSSTITTVEIMCYVPIDNPSQMDLFVNLVKEVLKQLRPMLKNAYNDIGDYIDDEIKAVMRTLQYTYYKKIT